MISERSKRRFLSLVFILKCVFKKTTYKIGMSFLLQTEEQEMGMSSEAVHVGTPSISPIYFLCLWPLYCKVARSFLYLPKRGKLAFQNAK